MMNRYLEPIAVLILAALFVALHFKSLNQYSLSWDEWADLEIARCLAHTTSASACSMDGTQFRLPHILSAYVVAPALAVAGVTDVFSRTAISTHAVVSLAFVVSTMIGSWYCARVVYGKLAALLALVMMTLSSALLSSASLLLTQSNSLPTILTLASIVSAASVIQRFSLLRLGAFACLVTLLAWSSILCVPLVAVLILWICAQLWCDHRNGTAWTFVLLTVGGSAIFFAAQVMTPFGHLTALYDYLPLRAHMRPWWNPLGEGLATAPWYFSILLCAVKFGPVWTLTLPLATLSCLRRKDPCPLEQGMVINNLVLLLTIGLKSSIFKYDAPHHQWFLYPLAYVSVGAFLVRSMSECKHLSVRGCAGVLLVGSLLFEALTIVRVTPAYWLSGIQYSERFIGDFYGPAVVDSSRTVLGSQVLTIARRLESQGQKVFRVTQKEIPVAGDCYVVINLAMIKGYYAPKPQYLAEVLNKRCALVTSEALPYEISHLALYDCRGQTKLVDYQEYANWLRDYPANVQRR